MEAGITVDYSLAFSECQRLYEIQRKLQRAHQALKSNISIAEGYQSRWVHLVSPYIISLNNNISLAFKSHRLELEGHDAAVQEMLKYSKGIMHLVRMSPA
jgi:hypothetical protein